MLKYLIFVIYPEKVRDVPTRSGFYKGFEIFGKITPENEAELMLVPDENIAREYDSASDADKMSTFLSAFIRKDNQPGQVIVQSRLIL